MNYRDAGAPPNVPCARCGASIDPSAINYGDDGRALCVDCDRQTQVLRTERDVERDRRESARGDFMLRHARLLIAGCFIGLGLVVWGMVTVLEPVTRRIEGKSPLPALASATALPWPGGIRVDVRAPPGTAVEVSGHRAQVGPERSVQVEIPRPEAEAIRAAELPVRLTPAPRDEAEFRAEVVTVTVPRLAANPAP